MPIPIPCTGAQLTRLDQDFLEEAGQLMIDQGIPDPFNALLVLASR